MKIAILLCGNIRSWEKTKESFDNFFKNIKYDLFISTYNKQFEYHPYYLERNPDFKDNFFNENTIKKMFHNIAKDIIITDYIENDKFIEQERTKMNPDMKDYFHGFSQFNNIKKGIEIMEKFEKENNFKYDIVIKTRFDLLYNNPLTFTINNNEILIDTNNTFPNDWLFIIERNKINDFVNFLINEYYELKYKTSTLKPPHGIFENSCRHNNLKIKPNNYINRLLSYLTNF